MSESEQVREDIKHILEELPSRVVLLGILSAFGFVQIWILSKVATEEEAEMFAQEILLGLDIYGFVGLFLAVYIAIPFLNFGMKYWHKRFGKVTVGFAVMALGMVVVL